MSPPGSGVRLAVRGEHDSALTLGRSDRPSWVKYGATVGGYVDASGQQRVVSLSVIADFADPLRAADAIPFTEQVGLGGDRPMRGFREGRLIDRSSLVAEVEYQWPVWVWLDGSLNYSVGNVFGRHLEGFDLELLRQSLGIGVRATGTRSNPFEVLVAMGTKPFRDGGGLDSVRFVVGASSGF